MNTSEQQHPSISATVRHVSESLDDVSIELKEPVIRLKLDKPEHWDWQLTTSADTTAVIQLLDKDGRLLVETSGRMAQRARGSFRDGLKSHESFPELVKKENSELAPKWIVGNRNFEGFSSKYGSLPCGFKPRKSHSEATVSSSSSTHRRKVRKRHSSNASELGSSHHKALDAARQEAAKKYSTGDYLRQQIFQDISQNDDVSELQADEVAKNRCKKIKAYLRSNSDGVQRSITPDNFAMKNHINPNFDNDEKENDYTGKRNKSSRTNVDKKLNKEDLDKIRNFLQEKIQAKMQQEQFLQRTSSFPIQCNNTEILQKENIIMSRMKEMQKKYSGFVKGSQRPEVSKNYKTRKIRSDVNIRLDPQVLEDSRSQSEKRQQKFINKNSSVSEKKKLYRKTRSDILLSHHLGLNSMESESDFSTKTNYPTRRIKSHDNFERSWREHKEHQKPKCQQKQNGDHNVVKDDFMKKTRCKDFQESKCNSRNCEIYEYSNKFTDSVRNVEVISPDSKDSKTPERPGTSLQENYLVIDAPTLMLSNIIQERLKENNKKVGNTSMSKRENKIMKGSDDFCANSNVKKSDTFKIVNGGEEDGEHTNEELCYDYKNKSNEDITKDYFKRVYELLRRRQDEAKRQTENRIDEKHEDTSSSNYLQDDTQIKKRRRRRKMIKVTEGKFIIFTASNQMI